MKYKINYSIGGENELNPNAKPFNPATVLQPMQIPIQTPIQTLPRVGRIPISEHEPHLINPLAENMTNEEIINICSLNKTFCQKMNWEKLIKNRKINIENVLNLDDPLPTMCNNTIDVQLPFCRKFYNYTKYEKYTKHNFKIIAVNGNTAFSRSMVLKNDGTVNITDSYRNTRINDEYRNDLNNVVSIAAGENHGMALKNDRTIVIWGGNDSNEFDPLEVAFRERIPPANLNNVVAIATSESHTIALQNDGTVVQWNIGTKWNLNDVRSVPPSLNNVVAIAAGYFHSMALQKDGTVVGWGCFGRDDDDDCDMPDGLNNVVAIAAGEEHAIALKKDGTIVQWGNYSSKQREDIPKDLNDVVAIAAGKNHSIALKNDGTIVIWGGNDSNEFEPLEDGFRRTRIPPGLNNVVAIAAGGIYHMALQNDGTVCVWDGNDFNIKYKIS